MVCSGMAASVAYQMLYTLPRWQPLVGDHLESGKTSAQHALVLLALFGAVYNIHSYAQARSPHILCMVCILFHCLAG